MLFLVMALKIHNLLLSSLIIKGSTSMISEMVLVILVLQFRMLHTTSQRRNNPASNQIVSLLLRPRNWNTPTTKRFPRDSYEVGELCCAAEQVLCRSLQFCN
ncbi:hypothetical protein MKX01_020622 [Papaver californicum]|nr:hypothetical protein MKX01_020622 [Papaver californicum]